MSEDKTRILTAEEAARLAAPAADADDRTRVLSAEEAARIVAQPRTAPGSAGARPEPRLVGDKIVFFCSNGHRIIVDRSLAGKRGNCSKQGCGVPVAIPVPPGLDAPPEGGRPPAAAPAADEPAPQEPAAPAAPPAPAAGFDFGSKADFQPGSPAGEPPPPPREAIAGAPAWEFADGGPPPVAVEPGALDVETGAGGGGWALDVGDIDHPTARLVARLWQERAHGGIVEVHLAGGGVIMPEFYDPRWSCGDHAVFAALAPDGTVTLTAVAWGQIQRVVVRQVQGKPDGMFGE